MNSEARYGKFTSSNVGDLLKLNRKGDGFGEAALTYIKTRGMERRLKRSISNETNAKETSWGNLVEQYVFGLLGLDYTLISQESIIHPKHPFWCGRPDGNRFIEEKTVFDVKSPFTLNSFCTLIDSWNVGGIKEVEKEHKMGAKYYWQIVSNAILTDSTHGELIVFCPYLAELTAIRQLASEAPAEIQAQFYWLNYAFDNELPYLIEGGHYKNLNVLRFPIPDEDKQLLETAVIEAEKILSPNILLAQSEPGVTLIQKA